MSIWLSETTGLASKRQLQSYRRDRWRGLLQLNGLHPDQQSWWSEPERALERQLWDEADAEYASRKAALRAALAALPAETLAIYFSEIGVDPQDLDIWLGSE